MYNTMLWWTYLAAFNTALMSVFNDTHCLCDQRVHRNIIFYILGISLTQVEIISLEKITYLLVAYGYFISISIITHMIQLESKQSFRDKRGNSTVIWVAFVKCILMSFERRRRRKSFLATKPVLIYIVLSLFSFFQYILIASV